MLRHYLLPAFPGLALLLVLLGLLAGARPAARRQAEDRMLQDRLIAQRVVNALEGFEARMLALRTTPNECADAIGVARRSQRGSMVFVKGDHCAVVRDLPARRRR